MKIITESQVSYLFTFGIKPNVFEGHLCSQERTLAVLLEQAFRIKEEVAAGLQSAQGSIQVQALSRKLLENHILTITRIVKQLSLDIQALERQFAHQDSVTSGATLAIQCLDQKNMVGIGDLRGRVARCDASIAKLSTDVSSGERQMVRLQQEVAKLSSAIDVQLKELEVKLNQELRRVEHSQIHRSSMSDLQRQVKLLEDRVSGELKKAKEQSYFLRKWTEQQLNSMIQTHAESSKQLRSLLQGQMLEAQSRLSDRLQALEVQLMHLESQKDQADRIRADQLKCNETRVSKKMTSVENSLHRELQLLKQEYHKGFLSVHDAIESLRQIADIKSRLDKENIRHICNKITVGLEQHHL
ncbi:protein FAM81B isoform X1 [Channa argus]|uniref:protein FAM81B isoform X1 n=1 Tax=Channa argus TaxID=215402 RepID=UPI0035209DE1